MPRGPAAIARWLAIAYAAGVLAFDLWNADALDAALLGVGFLPWLVGPAAAAAWLAHRAGSAAEAWAFVGAEAAAVASTAGLWILLIRAPDAQNGVAILLFPLVQFAALLAYALAVAATARLGRRRSARRGRDG